MSSGKIAALPATALRWQCDPAEFPFETTEGFAPASGMVGQPTAWEALEFGLECDAPGQNVFVRGVPGTGRMTMIRKLLAELEPTTTAKRDRCYVHNFKRPDRPRLITLPPGEAANFERLVRELSECIRDTLPKTLDSEPVTAARNAIQERIQDTVRQRTEPFDQELRRTGMALVSVQQGQVAQTVIFPLVEGEPVAPQQFFQLVAQGKIDKQRADEFESQHREAQKRLAELSRELDQHYRAGAEEVRALHEQATRELLGRFTSPITQAYDDESVSGFIDDVVGDVIEHRLTPGPEMADPVARYGVNTVLTHDDGNAKPVVEENTPNLINLLGTVEPEWGPQGMQPSDYRGIHGGALLRADGGYLIIDAHDVLSEPGAWGALTRTLRTGYLEIVPAELGWLRPHALVKPEPIEISVRVILIGDAMTYYQLDRLDPDFSELFKVLADFDHELVRNDDNIQQYASVLSQIARDEGLLHFHRSAVAELAEHGARVASKAQKLTARFGRIADLAREAAFLARRAKAPHVVDEHVREAVERTKRRASLPSRKFQDLVNAGTIRVETQGAEVGQINGLAVIQSGPLTYGFPARITATIGPGRAGLINIEGRASMSGSIHTKGFHILGGLLRHLLRTPHPLAFSASIAFEQSYGGIDGDSASGAEMCCLLSALTNVPIKQSFAMTGAVDQHGHVQAIGGVNEKIEGFFDACRHFGLTGEQGVIIPKSNAGDLMLRDDVVQACEDKRFFVYAVEHIHEAIALLTDMPAGTVDENGAYPENSLLHLAVVRAGEFWRRTLSSPDKLVSVAQDGEEDPEATRLPGVDET